MQVRITRGGGVPRPGFVWIGIALEIFTGILAIPVGLIFIQDPSGRAMQRPAGWIEATPFGTYLVRGSTFSR
jgi:hypothetical protein